MHRDSPSSSTDSLRFRRHSKSSTHTTPPRVTRFRMPSNKTQGFQTNLCHVVMGLNIRSRFYTACSQFYSIYWVSEAADGIIDPLPFEQVSFEPQTTSCCRAHGLSGPSNGIRRRTRRHGQCVCSTSAG